MFSISFLPLRSGVTKCLGSAVDYSIPHSASSDIELGSETKRAGRKDAFWQIKNDTSMSSMTSETKNPIQIGSCVGRF